MKAAGKPDPANIAQLENLSPADKRLLFSWMTEGGPRGVGISYKDAAKRVQDQFGIRTSATALHNFYHRYRDSKIPAQTETPADDGHVTIVIHIHFHAPKSS